MSQLMSEGSSNRASEQAVRSVIEPEFTSTWHPIGHSKVLDAVEYAVQDTGMEIVNKQFSLNTKGTRMFGVYNLSVSEAGNNYALGIRNALDKSYGLGLCAGSHVMVCDNMCFDGDSFIQFRKHTSGLDMDELISIADLAIKGSIHAMAALQQWQEAMKEVYVGAHALKAMVYDMMTKGVFSPSQFNAYHDALDEEKAISWGNGLDGTTHLYAVHGAATRVMRDWNLLRVASATTALNGICRSFDS